MYSDYKTTITYFIVVLAFIYSVYMDKPTLIDIIIVPLIVMWLILKTNSNVLIKDLLEILKNKWSK